MSWSCANNGSVSLEVESGVAKVEGKENKKKKIEKMCSTAKNPVSSAAKEEKIRKKIRKNNRRNRALFIFNHRQDHKGSMSLVI